ncbi:MAG TPA: hypothetical protein VMT55_03480, partial [Candidatus Sulfotelmatobacter sp.]|nr:hypothetical protein [Candidatus Sulfotelmatobacter sp.]
SGLLIAGASYLLFIADLIAMPVSWSAQYWWGYAGSALANTVVVGILFMGGQQISRRLNLAFLGR